LKRYVKEQDWADTLRHPQACIHYSSDYAVADKIEFGNCCPGTYVLLNDHNNYCWNVIGLTKRIRRSDTNGEAFRDNIATVILPEAAI
jgi:hypothetical protein